MESRITYVKGKIIIYPPKEFKGMDNPMIDDPKAFRKFMVNVLRSVFAYFKQGTYHKARIAYGTYTCALSGEPTKKKDTQCDHVEPIISLNENENDWNGIVSRCLNTENYQIVSKEAHKVKTGAENSKRFKGKKRT
jgi:hypothetical protein